MVEELKKEGIEDKNVLMALDRVPRHLFFGEGFEHYAYIKNRTFQIGEGQTISQPFTVAFQTQMLQIQKFDKVLEVGTGSGYQAAILADMGAFVYTIERHRSFYDSYPMHGVLRKYPNIKFFYGDGYEGLPSFSPFDKIILTAAAPFVPLKLIEQLKIGGIMSMPMHEEGTGKQHLYKIVKLGNGEVERTAVMECAFVPMVVGRN